MSTILPRRLGMGPGGWTDDSGPDRRRPCGKARPDRGRRMASCGGDQICILQARGSSPGVGPRSIFSELLILSSCFYILRGKDRPLALWPNPYLPKDYRSLRRSKPRGASTPIYSLSFKGAQPLNHDAQPLAIRLGRLVRCRMLHRIRDGGSDRFQTFHDGVGSRARPSAARTGARQSPK